MDSIEKWEIKPLLCLHNFHCKIARFFFNFLGYEFLSFELPTPKHRKNQLKYSGSKKSIFTTSFYFSQLMSTKWDWEIISFPHRFQYPTPPGNDVEKFYFSSSLAREEGIGNDDFTFQIFCHAETGTHFNNPILTNMRN